MNYFLICNTKQSVPADSPDATTSVNPETAALTSTYHCHLLLTDSVMFLLQTLIYHLFLTLRMQLEEEIN